MKNEQYWPIYAFCVLILCCFGWVVGGQEVVVEKHDIGPIYANYV